MEKQQQGIECESLDFEVCKFLGFSLTVDELFIFGDLGEMSMELLHTRTGDFLALFFLFRWGGDGSNSATTACWRTVLIIFRRAAAVAAQTANARSGGDRDQRIQ